MARPRSRSILEAHPEDELDLVPRFVRPWDEALPNASDRIRRCPAWQLKLLSAVTFLSRSAGSSSWKPITRIPGFVRFLCRIPPHRAAHAAAGPGAGRGATPARSRALAPLQMTGPRLRRRPASLAINNFWAWNFRGSPPSSRCTQTMLRRKATPNKLIPVEAAGYDPGDASTLGPPPFLLRSRSITP